MELTGEESQLHSITVLLDIALTNLLQRHPWTHPHMHVSSWLATSRTLSNIAISWLPSNFRRKSQHLIFPRFVFDTTLWQAHAPGSGLTALTSALGAGTIILWIGTLPQQHIRAFSTRGFLIFENLYQLPNIFKIINGFSSLLVSFTVVQIPVIDLFKHICAKQTNHWAEN